MTSIEKFSWGINYFLTEVVFKQLSVCLKTNKGCDVTPAEMSGYLSLPSLDNSAPLHSVPSFAFAKKNDNLDPNAPKCIYKFRSGQECNNVKEKGYDYCKSCLRKPNVKSKINNKGMINKNDTSIPVIPLDDKHGIYKVPLEKLIIRKIDHDMIEAIGAYDEDTEDPEIRELTNEDIDRAAGYGFSIGSFDYVKSNY